MKRVTGLVLVFAACVLGGASVSAGDQRPPFTLGVLRQDGILIPFATFDGGWKNYWPLPRVAFDVPIALDDVSKDWWPEKRPQTAWTLWLRSGETRPLKVTAPTWVRAQCQSHVGLRTDFKPAGPLPPPDATPYPKEGLATSVAPGVEPGIEPIAVLDESAQDWRWMLDYLTKHFPDLENQAIRRLGGWQHPYTIKERAHVPVVLEVLYRTPDARPGAFIFYFEAVRRYPEKQPKPPAEPPCDVLTYAWGWVRLSPDGDIEATVFGEVTDCYRWNVSFVFPLGAMRARDGRALWVVQSSSWQGETYYIIELLPPAKPNVLWQTPGGWCQ